jgi:hypothetical protein
MFDFCEDPGETNLKLVNLVAACSYSDTAFDTSDRSADRTEANREGFRRVFRGNRKSRYPSVEQNTRFAVPYSFINPSELRGQTRICREIAFGRVSNCAVVIATQRPLRDIFFDSCPTHSADST